MAEEKECSKCKAVKLLTAFYRVSRSRNKSGASSWCKACHSADGKRRYSNPVRKKRAAKCSSIWYAAHPEKYKERNLKQNYRVCGFTEELVRMLLEYQKGKCAICQKQFDERNPPRKDHVTGSKPPIPRGLLCDKCNQNEGKVRKWRAAVDAYCANPPVKRFGLDLI